MSGAVTSTSPRLWEGRSSRFGMTDGSDPARMLQVSPEDHLDNVLEWGRCGATTHRTADERPDVFYRAEREQRSGPRRREARTRWQADAVITCSRASRPSARARSAAPRTAPSLARVGSGADRRVGGVARNQRGAHLAIEAVKARGQPSAGWVMKRASAARLTLTEAAPPGTSTWTSCMECLAVTRSSMATAVTTNSSMAPEKDAPTRRPGQDGPMVMDERQDVSLAECECGRTRGSEDGSIGQDGERGGDAGDGWLWQLFIARRCSFFSFATGK